MVTDVPFQVAVMVTVWLVVTALEAAVKVAELAPAATVTEEGRLRAALLSARVTTEPPDGAAPLNVTVQLADAPEPRLAGLQLTLESTTLGACRAMVAESVLLPSVAVTVAD
ncbi:MAG TPA: hypothetical protein VG672_20870 [Bryobacteraceae bacterium]|nr:hypothetical protein [Bryobacteraceae bacterium]